MFNQIEKEYSIAVSEFSNLRGPIIEDNHPVIYGRIDAIDSAGNNWDTYEVKIIFPNEYPKDVPILYEIGGGIIRDKDWHINPDGSCCLGPRVKLLKELNGEINLSNWLKVHVVPFLANHHYRIRTGEYAGKVYSHGAQGIVEFYQELWSLNKRSEIIQKLKLITHRIKIGRNDKCYCGSGEKYKKCHLYSSEFDGIPLDSYSKDLKDIT